MGLPPCYSRGYPQPRPLASANRRPYHSIHSASLPRDGLDSAGRRQRLMKRTHNTTAAHRQSCVRLQQVLLARDEHAPLGAPGPRRGRPPPNPNPQPRSPARPPAHPPTRPPPQGCMVNHQRIGYPHVPELRVAPRASKRPCPMATQAERARAGVGSTGGSDVGRAPRRIAQCRSMNGCAVLCFI